LELITFACVDSIAEASALAQLHPDIINPEPTELIGSGKASDLSYVIEVTKTIKNIDSNILVEQAAGITTGQQVYDFICAGSDGAGAGSGIFLSKDPYSTACCKTEAQGVFQRKLINWLLLIWRVQER